MNPGSNVHEEGFEVSDGSKHEFGFGEGGVPWFLLVGYLAFLVFFTWYTLEYQLEDFQKQGPIVIPEAVEDASGGR